MTTGANGTARPSSDGTTRAAGDGRKFNVVDPDGPPPPVAPTDRHGAMVTWRMIHGQAVHDDILNALPAEWQDLALAARDAQPMPGDSMSPAESKRASVMMVLRSQRARHGDPIADRLQAALDATEAGPWTLPTDPAAPRRFTASIIGSSAFAAKRFERKWLVKGIMTLGQPCVVGGPRKALKTTTMVDLAISIGVGSPFLGEFETPLPRRVLFLSGESGDPTIQETAVRVCRAKGLDMDDLEGQVFWGFDLPQLSNSEDMEALAEFIRETGIEVVIIDPLYLCLLSGNSKLDAANLFDVGPLLKRITCTCTDAGATPVLVHHLRKNRDDPKSPPELEDLAFAGIQEFARQWILIGRRAAYEPGTGEHQLWLNVGGSAGHSGCWAVDVAEGTIGDEFEGRDWRVKIAKASEARAEAQQQAVAAKVEKRTEAERVKAETDLRKRLDYTEEALRDLRKSGPSTGTTWRNRLGWNGTKFGPILETLLSQDRVRRTEVVAPYGRGMKSQPGYLATPENLVGQPPDLNPGQSGTNPGPVRDCPGLDPDELNPGRDGGLLPEGEAPVESRIHSRSKSPTRENPKRTDRTAKASPGLNDAGGNPS